MTIHTLDNRGRPLRRLTAEEIAEHEREEERERLRSQIDALRKELDGLARRNWDIAERNARNAWRLGDRDYRPETPDPPSIIEAEIARVEAQLAAV